MEGEGGTRQLPEREREIATSRNVPSDENILTDFPRTPSDELLTIEKIFECHNISGIYSQSSVRLNFHIHTQRGDVLGELKTIKLPADILPDCLTGGNKSQNYLGLVRSRPGRATGKLKEFPPHFSVNSDWARWPSISISMSAPTPPPAPPAGQIKDKSFN